MAETCDYEIVDVTGNNLQVKYSLGAHSILVHLNWSGIGDVHEYIQAHVPSESLKALEKGPLDKEVLVGAKGKASLGLSSHVPVPEPIPPYDPNAPVAEPGAPPPAPSSMPGSGV